MKSKVKKKIDKVRLMWGVIFIAPLSIFYLVFRYYTSFESLLFSFFDYKVTDPFSNFVGLGNYIEIFTDPVFYTQLWNTVCLFLLGIVLGFWVPIMQALLLNELTKKMRGVYKYLLLLPAAIPGVASMALWKYIWEPSGGLANIIVGFFGLGPYDWLVSKSLVKFCLRFPGILGGGINVLIYMVAIDNVPQEMYEAARLDGASDFRQTVSITLPNIVGMIGVQFLLSLSTGLLAFDDVYVLTQGGPARASETLVMGIYNQVYTYNQYGKGMATSVVVLIITMALSMIQLKLQQKRDI